MSMADLDEIAGKLHTIREASRDNVEPEKLRIVTDLAMQLVDELRSVDDRLSALEKL